MRRLFVVGSMWQLATNIWQLAVSIWQLAKAGIIRAQRMSTVILR